MPLKCCVPCCNSNYDSTTEKVAVYKFPIDENKKIAWITAISRQNLVVTKYTRTVVCQNVVLLQQNFYLFIKNNNLQSCRRFFKIYLIVIFQNLPLNVVKLLKFGRLYKMRKKMK